MHPRILMAALPLSLLASCGGSEPAAETSSPSVSETIPQDTQGPANAASEPAAVSAEGAPSVAAATATPPPAFAMCRACHSVEPGQNGVGPTLFGIVGSKAGDVPGYSFSPALKESGITWNRDTLNTWLSGPMNMVPGTKMVIAIPDPAMRKAIIDYLETLK